MYKRLRTKNFKLHADAEFFFTQGLNLIIGPNYRGKSTLLRAIAFALFGTSVLPGKKENIQTRGSNGKVSVELDFVSPVDGETYMVERTLNDATLSHADGLVATGITNVNRKIEQLLGMSAKRWAQLGYARQKLTDHIVTSMGSTEVNKIIEELGGIDLVNSVLLLLKDENSRVEGALMAVPEVDLPALEARLAAAQAAEKTALSTQEQALLREKSAIQVLEESQISRTNAENLNSKRQILLAAHERAQRAVASAEEESKKLCERIQNKPCGEGDIELREQQVQALREKAAALIALNNEKNALSREVHSLYGQIQKWREAYEKNEAELNELQSCAVVDIANCEQEIKDRTERRAVMRAELAEKTSALANSTWKQLSAPTTASPS
jgi:DNA repair exonuclease SbcCD ATPase subunit